MALVIDKSYLGKGWDFPFAFTMGGSVSGAEYEKKIKINMLVVLSTEVGSRFMEPNFGCHLRQYIFEPDDFITYVAIKSDIINSLKKWVPVVDIVDIVVDIDAKQDNYVPILVKFKLKYTNAVSNLVFPFYKPEQV